MNSPEVTTKEWLIEQERKHNVENANNPDYMAIWWHIDDVKSRAEEDGIKLTDDEAREILLLAKDDHDCNYGITWETFDDYIQDMVLKRKIEKQVKGKKTSKKS
jgi:hypothetical protein